MRGESGPQLPLNLNLDSETRFQNFFEFSSDAELLKELKSETSFVYLWGSEGSGRSHLLQAVCHVAYSRQESSMCLSLTKAESYSPEMLTGIEGMSVVCLDDIQAITMDLAWEEAIFRLYNEAQETNCRLIISSDRSPQDLSVSLADLQSRLCGFPVFKLHSPGEKERFDILKFRAELRGMKLDNDILNYIAKNIRRNLHEIIDLLNMLDEASKIEKRKITVPLIKKVMGW